MRDVPKECYEKSVVYENGKKVPYLKLAKKAFIWMRYNQRPLVMSFTDPCKVGFELNPYHPAQQEPKANSAPSAGMTTQNLTSDGGTSPV
jgi:hypothetical protein